jgi:hypothetical protein
VTEDESDVVVAAGVGEPVPGMDTLAGDEQSLAEGSDSAEERFRLGGEVAAEAALAVLIEDDQVQGPGVEIDASVESGVGGRLKGTHRRPPR